MNIPQALWNFFTDHISGIAVIISILTFGLNAFLNPMTYIIPHLAALMATDFPTFTAMSLEGYGFVNYFVPLDELSIMVAAFVPTFILVTVIRMVKSLVPFIS